MGRPSKLTDKQWAEIERRSIAGESIRSLAAEFKVSEGTIRGRGISAHVSEIKDVAKQIARVQDRLAVMPISAQISAHSLAEELRSISTHLASAAKFGSMTAHRLSVIAHSQTDMIDEAAPFEDNTEALKSVLAMTKGANDAAVIGLNLLNANKETVKSMNEEKVINGESVRLDSAAMAKLSDDELEQIEILLSKMVP
jgi:hypothetical protein